YASAPLLRSSPTRRSSDLLILLLYLLTQIAYTFWLKRLVLIDVFIVATGFILRIAAGVAVLEPVQQVQRFSPWLYVFGGFLALRSEEHTSELQSRETLVCR